MAVDDRLSDLLVEWEQGRRSGQEPSVEDLCRDTPDLLPFVRESIASLRATEWMFEPPPSEPSSSAAAAADPGRAALHDTELPASHLTAQEFAASIFQSGLLSRDEIEELQKRLNDSALPGEAREIASKLVNEGKLTRYQAAVLLKASKDPLLIDNYVILDTLDTGGMGLVFKALHRSMNRVVALKLLPAAMMSARDTVKRFQREVQAAAALKHPNVVAAYDADESEEIAYLVLEFVDGTNLYRLVKEQGPQPLADAVDFVRQAATGLSYLHSRGIIHRDVKPANLLLAKDGTVKLLEMGLVRFASSEDLSCSEMDQELTQAGIVIGTVAYMSPEQALDTRSADQRSDIYSLGCTLFYLLTGRSLYHEETGMKTLLAHREQPVPSLREFCEEAPVSLDAVFRTMVAKRPADRLQSMDEVIAALDACVPPPATPTERSYRRVPIAPPRIGTRPARLWQSRWFRISAAIIALAAAVIGSIYLAVIVIRIKTSQGSTELTVTDPNAKIEIETRPAGPAVSQLVPPTEAGSVVAGASSRRGRPRGPRFGGGVGEAIFPGTPPLGGGMGSGPRRSPLQPKPAIPVMTATVRKGDFDVYLSNLLGVVRASQTVTVTSQAFGEIIKVNFTEGQFVHGGDVLFEIDPRPYQLRVEEAQGKFAQNQKLLAAAQNELQVERKSNEKTGNTNPASNKAQAVLAAEGRVKNDQTLLDEARLQLSRCRIVAPINGRIGLRLLDKGNVIHEANGFSTRLATIAQFQPVDILFRVPQEQIEHVQQKLTSTKETTVEVWNYVKTSTQLATAQIVGIDNTVNPQSGTIEVKARAANDDNRLFPGETVVMRLLVNTLHDVVIVPTAAVQKGDGETFAYVVKRDHTVQKQKLLTGPSEKKETVVTSGLSPGETVVIEGADKLVKGSQVSVGFKAEDQDQTATTTSTSASTNLDRQVADWVLANRGRVTLKEYRGRTFEFADSLPPTDFHLETISLKDYVSDDSHAAALAEGTPARRFGSGGFRGRRSRVQSEAAGSGEQTSRTFHRIEFSNSDLDRLASLVELRSLTFASSAVTDDVLARLKGLTKLESLVLEGASITDAGLASLLGMSHLTHLDLDSTAVTDAGLTEIAKLKSLNDLSLIPEAERSGRNPRTSPSLRLGQTSATVNGIDELQRALPNCIVFASHLGFSPAPPAPGSSDRDWAQWLLSPNGASGRHLSTDLDPGTSISSYEDLPPVDFHIVELGFNFDVGISETMLRRMVGLTKLRRLHFQILMMPAFAGLDDLKQLEGLSIQNTDTSDDALQVLGNLVHLKVLGLGDRYFTERDLARLAPLHDLTSLSLGGRWKALQGSGFGALSPLTHLTSLDLDGAGIQDEALAPIGKLVTLEELNLSRTGITGKGLASLEPLSRLKTLRLSGCSRLEISSLEALAKFPHLESLALNNCSLNDSAVELLKKLTSLRELSVDSTHMSPAAYQNLISSLPNCNINGTRPFMIQQQQQSAGNKVSAWGEANSGGGFLARRQGAPDGGKPAGTGFQKQSNAKAGVGALWDSEADAQVARATTRGKRSPDQDWLDRMKKETSPDRAIAVWVHAFAGDFGIEKTAVRASDPIPAGDFPLRSIFLYDLATDRDFELRPPAEQRVQIPAAVLSRLAQLTHLEFVHLDCRECTDATLQTLGRIPSLKALQLRHSSVTDAGLASLGDLKKLRWLDLRYTAITDKGLGELAKLKLFSGVQLPRGPLPWNPPVRPELLIDQTPTTEAGVVEFQKAVPNCLISATHLMDIEPARSLLGGTWIAPFPPAPGSTDRDWADWLFAYLHGARILTDADPETWFDDGMNLPPIEFHITHIEFGRERLDSNQVRSVEHLTPLLLRHLGDLPQLERLTVYFPKDAFLPAVATLKRLKGLSLRKANQLTDEALKTVGTMTNLEELGIESDQITDASLKSLSNLKALTALDLSEVRNVHGSGLADLSALKKLKELNLDRSGIDDAGMRGVAALPSVEILLLSGTWISPQSLGALADMSKLRALDLSNCRRIDDTAFAPLKKVKSLREVWVGGSRIPFELSAEYEGALPGCKILWKEGMAQLLDRLHAVATPSATRKPMPAAEPRSSKKGLN